MNKRDIDDRGCAKLVPEPRGAVLRPDLARDAFRIRRLPPSPDMTWLIRHLWFIDWDLPAPFIQSVLPRPAVNLVSEHDRWHASGVQTRRYDRHLDGRGAVYGILFQPAGFGALHPRPLHLLTDSHVDMAAETGTSAQELFRSLQALDTDEARVGSLLERLQPHLHITPGLRERVELINGWVELAETDEALLRAEQFAARVGCSLRTLQRRLRDQVGVGPKALLRRFRLQEAAARLAEGAAVPQARLAAALGYADQSHFVRDFKAAVGQSPAAYAASIVR